MAINDPNPFLSTYLQILSERHQFSLVVGGHLARLLKDFDHLVDVLTCLGAISILAKTNLGVQFLQRV